MSLIPGRNSLLHCSLLLALLPQQPGAFEVMIGKGVVDPLPIAVVPFERPATLGTGPGQIIADDLRNSGSFKPIPPEDMPQYPSRIEAVQYADWRRLGVENLVIGRLSPTGVNSYQLEYRLLDVYKEEQINGQRLTIATADLRRAAHRFSDSIYQDLIGAQGIFSTFIAYVSIQDTSTGERSYQLEVAEYDGHGAHILVSNKEPLLSPAWSPTGDQLAYVSFEKGAPTIYLQELMTGDRRRISASPGINSAPRFSPEGQRLALMLSKDGNPEIYVLHIAGGLLQRITDHPAIDTEPDWSPDGRSLVFTSDRSGQPQIYRTELSTGEVHRLTFDGRYNAGAVHSPDGSRLVMVHRGDTGDYHIAHRPIDDESLQRIEGSGLDESPGFAPNGRMLIYAGANDSLALAPLGLGRPTLIIKYPGKQLREPAWGPYMVATNR